MKRENAILAVWMGIFALPFLGNGNQWAAETAAIASAKACLLYTSPSPRDVEESRMPSSA